MSQSKSDVALVSLVFAVVATVSAAAGPVGDSALHPVWEQDDGSRREEQLVVSPCVTSDGDEGLCTSLSQCHSNFKLLEITNNTCNYSSASGSKMFGVCCTNVGNDEVLETSTSARATEPVTTTEIPGPEKPNPSNLDPLDSSTSIPQQNAYPTSRPPTSSRPWPPTHFSVEDLTMADMVAGTFCGYQDDRRIVNGEDAKIGEWPWMATVLRDDQFVCGGSLINNLYVLTAAHCVPTEKNQPPRWKKLSVKLGDHNIRLNTEVQHVEKAVERIVTHAYNSNNFLNDIALLKMDSPVTFTRNINPICLPFGHEDYTGLKAVAIGWGLKNHTGPVSEVLQKVTLPIWSNHKCQIKYRSIDEDSIGIPYQFLCAGGTEGDTCRGDSGGPLMLHINGRWTQVGINSFGVCGELGYPTGFTRVTTYRDWIISKLQNII